LLSSSTIPGTCNSFNSLWIILHLWIQVYHRLKHAWFIYNDCMVWTGNVFPKLMFEGLVSQCDAQKWGFWDEIGSWLT
jgi:hypothetical protein